MKEFRRIVESQAPVEGKLKQLSELSNKCPQFADIWARLSNSDADFPRSFFYMQLTAIPGIGSVVARRLFESGFLDIPTLQAASDAQLREVRGVGPNLIAAIRNLALS